MRSATLSLWAALLFLLVSAIRPTASHGDEIYSVIDGQLQRLGVDDVFIEPVAPLDLELQSLSFSKEGRLLGLTQDGEIYGIDRQTAEHTLITTLPDDGGYFYGQLTAAGVDYAFVVRWNRLFFGEDILLIRLSTGEVSVVGRPFSAADPTHSFSLDSLSLLDGALIGFARERGDWKVFSISAANGAATALSPEVQTIPISSDVDSDGHLWLVSDTLVTPPSYLIYSIDPVTGETIEDKAFYSFLFNPPFAVFRDRSGDCRSSDQALCFLDGRFRVTAQWRDSADNSGAAKVVPGPSDSAGLMWFFSADNWELSVKMLDACGINDRFWLFLSGTTNVELTVTVEDVTTGEPRTYENPLDTDLKTVLDTDAFGGCEP